MFEFDGNYENLAQVEPYFPEFLRLKEQHGYQYNAQFTGLIDGLAGAEKESAAIYLLQKMHDEKRREAAVGELKQAGYTPVQYEGKRVKKYASVAMVGTNWSSCAVREFPQATVVFGQEKYFAGKPEFIIPARRRKTGFQLDGSELVLVKEL